MAKKFVMRAKPTKPVRSDNLYHSKELVTDSHSTTVAALFESLKDCPLEAVITLSGSDYDSVAVSCGWWGPESDEAFAARLESYLHAIKKWQVWADQHTAEIEAYEDEQRLKQEQAARKTLLSAKKRLEQAQAEVDKLEKASG